MPGDEYSSTISGGLKLKGSKPDGVKKKKKKKSKTTSSDPAEGSKAKKSALQGALEEEDASGDKDMDEAELRDLDPKDADGKTASERQFEEMRRKRLQDRLARSGVKTHKQRVEELNKYLSTLSEHHDMPKIGPG